MPESLNTLLDEDQPISILSEIGLPYVWIPYLVLDIYGPAMKEKGWLYTMLTRFKNSKDSSTFVGVRTLATACGIHRDTVQEWARHLESLGLIKITPGDHSRSTLYTLLMPPMPPPENILKAYYPNDWEPPKRALKALENVRFHLSEYATPQASTPSKGGVLSGRTGVPNGRIGVLDERTGRPNTAAVQSHPVGHNNTFNNSLNKTNEQEDKFVSSLFEIFLTKSPNTVFERFEDLWFKTLNLCEDNPVLAQDRFKKGVLVVEQSKIVKDPEGLLWKAIDKGWSPRATPEATPAAGDEQKRIEDKYEEELKTQRRSAKVEVILDSLEFFKKHDKKHDHLETVKKLYEGNPHLNEAIKRFTERGK
jgi:hypothetical protein